MVPKVRSGEARTVLKTTRQRGARCATFFGFPWGRWAYEVSEEIVEGVHKLDLVEL